MSDRAIRSEGPLAGLRVLSFAQLAQGPAAVQLLADQGADVIKVERPKVGAWERSWAGSNAYLNGESLFFLGFNRNQRSLTVDLKHLAGKEIIYRLIRDTDVLIENFRPGVMERLSLGYATLSEINPRLVYCSSTGFGPDGPYRDLAGQDLILQAESGLASVTGRRGDPPTPTGAPIVDIHAAALLAYGITAALLGRERTGRGRRVESSLLEAALHLQMEPLTYHMNGRWLRERSETGIATTFHGAPYGVYATADGHIALSMSPLDRLAEVLDLPALRQFTEEDAYSRADEIFPVVAERLTAKTTREWLDILQPADVWCGAVNSYADLERHPQLEAVEAFRTVEHPTAGDLRLLRAPLRMDGSTEHPMVRPPLLGEHTREILESLGYSDEVIAKLEEQGVV
jgi:crotonobetainyl-CoA:carnitine CoA-transferase CaiB-like acyl-CoA transferase